MRAAALCAGYGGLELGLQLAGVDVDLVWYSEIDKHASLVMAHHHPEAPNLGNLTTIEDPPPADIVTAGFPCQPVSTAGKREGTNDDRWLIHDVVGLAQRAGARWLLLENVPGLFSANDGEAFGQVCDALAEGGFDAEWAPLRASDVGACHRRERWFCLARHSSNGRRDVWPAANMVGSGEHEVSARGSDSHPGLLPTPRANSGNGPGQHGDGGLDLQTAIALLPTPTATQPGGSAEQHLARKRGGKMNRQDPSVTDLRMAIELLPTPTKAMGDGGNERRGGDRGDELLLAGLVKTLLPTPTTQPTTGNGHARHLGGEVKDLLPTLTRGVPLTDAAGNGLVDWGQYAAAIDRHARAVTGRLAPSPTNDAGRLSPVFVEWMMGLPEGHVTDVDGLSRAQMLGRLGNGVVPQQAAHAITQLIDRFGDAA